MVRAPPKARALAQLVGVEVRPVNVGDADEIKRALADLARSANGGLIVTPSAGTSVHRDLIITLAAQHKLPAVYSDRFNVTGGGLLSYGPDRADQFRRAAGYVDRILKGAKPADLPVVQSSKFELVINAQAARMLSLPVPATSRPRRRGDRMSYGSSSRSHGRTIISGIAGLRGACLGQWLG